MTAENPSRARIEALDMTKGALVVIMVIYHSLNYSSQYYLGFKYLSFLPPSFIFITGFLLTKVYSVRYDAGEPRINRRLIVRGGKLLALFSLLNVAVYLAGRRDMYGRSLRLGYFFRHGYQVYVTGSGRFAAFEVLLPIAYLLLVAPLLLWMNSRRRFLLIPLTVGLLLFCSVADERSDSFVNLSLMSAGVLGMLAGRLPTDRLNILARYRLVTVLAYCVYFPLGVSRGYIYPIQLLGAIVALAMIYGISVRFGRDTWPRRRLIRLGRYSLVSYILQIGILQVLSRLIGRPAPFSTGSAFIFSATLVLMTVLVELLERSRTRSARVEKLYKAVFA